MSTISINKSIASAVLAFGVAFSGQALAVDKTDPMEAASGETKQEVFLKTDINTKVAATVGKFQDKYPGATKILDAAKGVLVCPSITKGGVVIGIAGGTCALRIGGAIVDHYGYSAVKFGLLAGVKSYSLILAFNTDAALDKFRSAKREWVAGSEVSVALGEKGKTGAYSKTGEFDTANLKSPVVAFIFGESGIMGDVSVDGGRIKRLDAK